MAGRNTGHLFFPSDGKDKKEILPRKNSSIATNFAARNRSGTWLSKFFPQNDVTRRRTPRSGIRVQLHTPLPFFQHSLRRRNKEETENHRRSATFPNNSLKFNSIRENKSSETLADDSWKRDESRFLFRLFLPIRKNKVVDKHD